TVTLDEAKMYLEDLKTTSGGLKNIEGVLERERMALLAITEFSGMLAGTDSVMKGVCKDINVEIRKALIENQDIARKFVEYLNVKLLAHYRGFSEKNTKGEKTEEEKTKEEKVRDELVAMIAVNVNAGVLGKLLILFDSIEACTIYSPLWDRTVPVGIRVDTKHIYPDDNELEEMFFMFKPGSVVSITPYFGVKSNKRKLALGGLRQKLLGTPDDYFALMKSGVGEALNLARAMLYKNAVFYLPYEGIKTVHWKMSGQEDEEAFARDWAYAAVDLGLMGLYLGGPDQYHESQMIDEKIPYLKERYAEYLKFEISVYDRMLKRGDKPSISLAKALLDYESRNRVRFLPYEDETEMVSGRERVWHAEPVMHILRTRSDIDSIDRETLTVNKDVLDRVVGALIAGGTKKTGGLPLDEIGPTGYGQALAAEEVYNYLKKSGKEKYRGLEKTGYVQGFGDVGGALVRALIKLSTGWKVQIIHDISGVVFKKNGFTLDEILEALKYSIPQREKLGVVKLLGYISDSYIEERGVDVGRVFAEAEERFGSHPRFFLPAATQNVINERNISTMPTDIVIVEGSNNAFLGMEKKLFERGIFAIDGFAVNGGGVICCDVENAAKYKYAEAEMRDPALREQLTEEVYRDVRKKISVNVGHLMRKYFDEGVSPSVEARRLARKILADKEYVDSQYYEGALDTECLIDTRETESMLAQNYGLEQGLTPDHFLHNKVTIETVLRRRERAATEESAGRKKLTEAEEITFTPDRVSDINDFDKNCNGRSFILAINPGSTSTKLGIGQIVEGRLKMYETKIKVEYPGSNLNLKEKSEVIAGVITNYLGEQGILPGKIAAVCGRGGFLRPNKGGLIRIDENVIKDLLSAGLEHASNMGAIVAQIIAEKEDIPSYILDPVVTYNMSDEASLAGHRGFERRSYFHALNIFAVVRALAAQVAGAEDIAQKPEKLNVVACHLGGGISVAAIESKLSYENGKLTGVTSSAIDVNNALLGEGPFTPERSVPQLGEVVSYAHRESDRPLGDILKSFIKKSGLISYTGTNDLEELEALITDGRSIKSDLRNRLEDEFELDRNRIRLLTNTSDKNFNESFSKYIDELVDLFAGKNVPVEKGDLETMVKSEIADLALRAMALQIAKQMNAMTANFTGATDGFLLTGDGAKSKLLVRYIRERLGGSGKVFTYAGSLEQWAMLERTSSSYQGKLKANKYEPIPDYGMDVFPVKKEYTTKDLEVASPKGEIPFVENVSDLARYARTDKTPIIVVAGPEENSLRALMYAYVNNWIKGAILVGDREDIMELVTEYFPDMDEGKLSRMNFQIEHMPRPPTASDKQQYKQYASDVSARAVNIVAEKRADLVMKGVFKSSIILKYILEKWRNEYGFISLVTVLQGSAYDKRLIFFSDPGINTTTDERYRGKVIAEIKNAVRIAQLFGRKTVRVALISAVEEVSENIPSTGFAEGLAGLPWPDYIKVSGPLSVDCALSKESAEGKGIDLEKNAVAGQADVLIFLGREAITGANAFYKAYAGHPETEIANIVTGEKTVPFVIISRTDAPATKVNTVLGVQHCLNAERNEVPRIALEPIAEKKFPVIHTVDLGDGYREQILGPAARAKLYAPLSRDPEIRALHVEPNSEYALVEKNGINIGLVARGENNCIVYPSNKMPPESLNTAMLGYIIKAASSEPEELYTYETIPPFVRTDAVRKSPAGRMLRTSRLTKQIAHIDSSLCSNCRKCDSICPERAIVMSGGEESAVIGVNADYCKGCGLCLGKDICPKGAISFVDKAPFLPERPFLFPVIPGRRIEIAAEFIADFVDYIKNLGTSIYEDSNVLQIEVVTGGENFCFTFGKTHDNRIVSMVAMRKKTVAVYMRQESDKWLAEKVREAGYKVTEIKGEGESEEDVLEALKKNIRETQAIITSDINKMSVGLQRAIFEELKMNVFHPKKRTFEPILDDVLSSFLPVTEEYRQEPVAPGNRFCKGCGEIMITNTVLKKLAKLGWITVNVDVASCHYVCVALTAKDPTIMDPYVATNFAGGPAVAGGIESALRYLRKKGKFPKEDNHYVVAHLGDGAAYDIGFATLSGWVERGHRGLIIVHDNGVYGNTGGQRSSATPMGAQTTNTDRGEGKAEERKDLVEILAAHGSNVYVAYASMANLKDLEKKVEKASEHNGPSVIVIYSSCPTGHGYKPSQSIRIAKIAIETGEWLLYEIENGVYKINYDISGILEKPEEHRGKLTEYYRMQ
ncbi:MAG: butyrate kinase, partial [Candidatus Omnitrophica bacterium]|nr:butyrate kinase [Candidatus Omnitrophota bacterium]